MKDEDTGRQWRRRAKAHLWRGFLFTLFLLYPGVSSRVLSVLVCRNVNGVNYLAADMSLKCGSSDSEWNDYAGLAAFFTLVYPIGIPIFFFALLWRHRHDLRTTATQADFGFLYEAYTSQTWWFELVDMANKLILTSLLLFLPLDWQMPTGMIVITLYIIAVLLLQPYVRNGDDQLQQIGIHYLAHLPSSL
jgi:hypothetical protein